MTVPYSLCVIQKKENTEIFLQEENNSKILDKFLHLLVFLF